MSALKRILLAEDNPLDVELSLAAFEEIRLANMVDVVRDGVEVLDYLHRRGAFKDRVSGPPVVVLLDLKMPRIDGLEVLREMRADPELAKIPVVMLTSSREEKDVVTSYSLGINAYVVKPIDFTQFASAVRQIGAFWAVLNETPPPTRSGTNNASNG